MKQVKFKAMILGGHAHIAVYSGKAGYTLGKCGDICMTEGEWEAFAAMLDGIAFSHQLAHNCEVEIETHEQVTWTDRAADKAQKGGA